MEGRALRLLLSLLVIAIAGFLLLKPATKGPPPAPPGMLPAGASARVEGVRLLQSGPQGELALVSDSAEWLRDKELIHVKPVDIRFMSSTAGGQAPVRGHLTSEEADVATDAREFTLNGKVAAETFDGYRLETSHVRYHHATREVETDQPVSLDGPGLKVSGKGASVLYDEGHLEIRGRVHAHVIPALVEQHFPVNGKKDPEKP